MNYLQYSDKGQIICTGYAPDSSDFSNLGLILKSDTPFVVDFENDYISNGVIVSRPEKPSLYHNWDWDTKTWIPEILLGREALIRDITNQLNNRLYLPYNNFDADALSRERISGMIARLQRGDGLPDGWVGWRDASNQQQWVTDDAATVLANLTVLSRAIEDREQALLVASWTHKANIAALTDIDAIIGYDVTANWPV